MLLAIYSLLVLHSIVPHCHINEEGTQLHDYAHESTSIIQNEEHDHAEHLHAKFGFLTLLEQIFSNLGHHDASFDSPVVSKDKALKRSVGEKFDLLYVPFKDVSTTVIINIQQAASVYQLPIGLTNALPSLSLRAPPSIA